MIEEFRRRLNNNQDFIDLIHALDSVPELPETDIPIHISLEDISQIELLFKLQDEIKMNKLSNSLISQFKDVFSGLSKKDTILFQNCVQQYENYIRSLDYHCNYFISNLKLNELDLDIYNQVRGNKVLLDDLQDKIYDKFKELILVQLAQRDIIQINEQQQYIYQSQFIIIFKQEQLLHIQSNISIVQLQSDMLVVLDGFLNLCEVLELDLQLFVIEELAKYFRQLCISSRCLQIDECHFQNDFQKQLIAKVDLQQLSEKYNQLSQVESLKQNLVQFKDKYIDLMEQLDFNAQSTSKNWKNILFKQQKSQPLAKMQVKFFEELKEDCKYLEKQQCLNDEIAYQLIFDHYRLIDICLQHKLQQQNFQSLNFSISIYTQIESQLKKLNWDNEDLLNYMLQIKIILREYGQRLAEFVDL